MSARFEIVRTDADQPWHARWISNDRVIFTSENYSRMVGAERAILSFANSAANTKWTLRWNVEGIEKVFVNPLGRPPGRAPLVRYVDERYVPQPVVLDPPFYVTEVRQFTGEGRGTKVALVPFWHDSEHHSRNCYGDECTEGTPPIGTPVRGRMGTATFTGSES